MKNNDKDQWKHLQVTSHEEVWDEGLEHRGAITYRGQMQSLALCGPLCVLALHTDLYGAPWIHPQCPAPHSLQGAHPLRSSISATSCVQIKCQLLAEPTQGMSCKLPLSSIVV